MSISFTNYLEENYDRDRNEFLTDVITQLFQRLDPFQGSNSPFWYHRICARQILLKEKATPKLLAYALLWDIAQLWFGLVRNFKACNPQYESVFNELQDIFEYPRLSNIDRVSIWILDDSLESLSRGPFSEQNPFVIARSERPLNYIDMHQHLEETLNRGRS